MSEEGLIDKAQASRKREMRLDGLVADRSLRDFRPDGQLAARYDCSSLCRFAHVPLAAHTYAKRVMELMISLPPFPPHASMLKQTFSRCSKDAVLHLGPPPQPALKHLSISNRGSPVNPRMGAAMEQGPVRVLYWRFQPTRTLPD